MAPRVYVTRPVFGDTVERLKRVAEVRVNSGDRILSKSELIAHLKDADGALTMVTDVIDAELLAAAAKLKVVANFGVGINHIDVAAATRAGVIVTNTPGVLTETTADFAWTLLMAAARRVVEADKFARAGNFKAWGRKVFLGYDVYGKTLGLVGLGRIGQAVARPAPGLNLRGVVH